MARQSTAGEKSSTAATSAGWGAGGEGGGDAYKDRIPDSKILLNMILGREANASLTFLVRNCSANAQRRERRKSTCICKMLRRASGKIERKIKLKKEKFFFS